MIFKEKYHVDVKTEHVKIESINTFNNKKVSKSYEPKNFLGTKENLIHLSIQSIKQVKRVLFVDSECSKNAWLLEVHISIQRIKCLGW